jgi:hypothetical protein
MSVPGDSRVPGGGANAIDGGGRPGERAGDGVAPGGDGAPVVERRRIVAVVLG